MKAKRIMAVVLTAAVMLGIMTAPAARLDVKAVEPVYTNNLASDIPRVNVQTPQDAARIYAGLTWEQLDMKQNVRLTVTDSDCGPLARKALSDRASALGATLVKTLDMNLERFLKSGWSDRIKDLNNRIRVCIALPAGCDRTKDYAVLSLKADGTVEVLADLDPEPTTITVDSDYFDTFMIVAAPAGTFAAYRVENPAALDDLLVPGYVRKINSTIPVSDYYMGVLTDIEEVRAAAGVRNVSLLMKANSPGPDARYALYNTVRQANKEKKINTVSTAEEMLSYSFYEMEMSGGGERITNTNGKLRITMVVPYDFPAYADYAVAVLNMDGSATIMKDIDANDSTITIDTDQFRTYMFLWGKKGAFDALP